MTVRLIHATARSPGAIAIVQLFGEDCAAILRAITGVNDWPIARLRLVNLAGIDEGIAGLIAPSVAQIMPHGGLRVIQRLTERLVELGVKLVAADDLDPQRLFPEAIDRFEALAMCALSRAASPLAIDLLLDQPRRWREWAQHGEPLTEQDRARSARLNHLIDPPIVVLAGAPNVGKSTLSNALLGRSMSITADIAGTTRDYIAAFIDLAGLTVQWHDTPGVRDSDDPIERKAIDIARRLIERADLLIAMRDLDNDWPPLPDEADVLVMNKVDTASPSPSADDDQTKRHDWPRERVGVRVREEAAPLLISALHGHGVASLVRLLRDRLVPPADLEADGLWLFDERLVHQRAPRSE